MFKVCIDPGHGQYNNQGVIKSYYEGTQMWKLGQYLQAAFEKRGVTVTNTRPRLTDNPGLEWRGQQAKGHDLFISLHSNAPGSSAVNYDSIQGVSIYDSVADQLDYLEAPLAAEIARLMNTKNLGVKHRWNTRADRHDQDYYGVLRNSVTVAGCPDAMLIEHGYHTNLANCSWLLHDNNLKMLATAMATMITQLWLKQHGYTLVEEEEVNFCKFGDGTPAAPDANVMAAQRGLLKVGIKMTRTINGELREFGADGSYGGATKNGIIEFEQKYSIKGNGEVFTAEHMRVLTEKLVSLSTGITQNQLDSEKEKLAFAKNEYAKLSSAVVAASNLIKTF